MAKNYRYELKYELSRADGELLKRQLRAWMEPDPHSLNEDVSYRLRSLYFDDPFSGSYYEKLDGVEFRRKYRIRMYNLDPGYLRLECKHKDAAMTYKEGHRISRPVAQALIEGNLTAVKSRDPFMNRFLAEALNGDLRPAVLVDYDRLAYIYPLQEVRVTFDENIRSGRYQTGFFDGNIVTLPVQDAGKIVLEVKFREVLPQPMAAVISGVPALREAFSKFARCCSVR